MAIAVQALSGTAGFEDGTTAGGNTRLVKAASVLFGFAFIWAGTGLWLMPGTDLSPDIFSAKMIISVLLVTAGVGMTQIATGKPQCALHLDPQNRQVHLMENLPRGRKHAVRSINYEDIARITVSDSEIVMLNGAGKILVELPLEGPDARLDAIAQLRSQSLAVS